MSCCDVWSRGAGVKQGQQQLEVDRLWTEMGRNSFRYRLAVLWIALPYKFKQAKDKSFFKNKLESHNRLKSNFEFIKGSITILNRVTTIAFKLFFHVLMLIVRLKCQDHISFFELPTI